MLIVILLQIKFSKRNGQLKAVRFCMFFDFYKFKVSYDLYIFSGNLIRVSDTV